MTSPDEENLSFELCHVGQTNRLTNGMLLQSLASLNPKIRLQKSARILLAVDPADARIFSSEQAPQKSYSPPQR